MVVGERHPERASRAMASIAPTFHGGRAMASIAPTFHGGRAMASIAPTFRGSNGYSNESKAMARMPSIKPTNCERVAFSL